MVDIANGTIALMEAAFIDPSKPCEVHNIGNQSPVEQTFIDLLQEKLGIQAEKITSLLNPVTSNGLLRIPRVDGANGVSGHYVPDGLDEWVAWYRLRVKTPSPPSHRDSMPVPCPSKHR